ncbi:MAG: aminoacyl-tRNA hydrolase [Propionibacteriaceae bacterium]|nr:aminoacyl-tRNA hydrolase [Propionibacteriaceae bacterium]
MTWLVAGLGNPGPSYANTRHNVGFMCADELASRAHTPFKKPLRFRADVCETRIAASGLGVVSADAEKLIIVKPRTFMNESGIAVGQIAQFAKVTADHIIVIHDELDIDFSALRLKLGGGDNGHNGLRSIRSHLGTGDFYRVRIGIGRPPGSQNPVDYVLGQFPKRDADTLAVNISEASDAVEMLITRGLEAAQNHFNR